MPEKIPNMTSHRKEAWAEEAVCYRIGVQGGRVVSCILLAGGLHLLRCVCIQESRKRDRFRELAVPETEKTELYKTIHPMYELALQQTLRASMSCTFLASNS